MIIVRTPTLFYWGGGGGGGGICFFPPPRGGGGGGGGSKFDLITSPGWRNLKILRKGGGSMVKGQAFLKVGGADTFLFIFFKFYHFYI